jgi:hypothetical protein
MQMPIILKSSGDMRLKKIIILVFLANGFLAYSQQVKVDTVIADTVARRKFAPTGLRIGTDMISLVKSQIQNDFTGWEVNADMDFYRYLLCVDYGNWGRTFRKDSVAYASSYNNDGRYWRVGVDANFLTRDPERNVFFIGLRYARSKYSETITIAATDPFWGDVSHTYGNRDIHANWLELNAGLKVKIYKFIWMGYRGSLKFGLKKDERGEMLSDDIPGYGNTDKDTAWGFTYSVFMKIPFRKTVSILPPKKKK